MKFYFVHNYVNFVYDITSLNECKNVIKNIWLIDVACRVPI